MKRVVDLGIAFLAGVTCTYVFAVFVGPYSLQVSTSSDGQKIVARMNKLTGRTEVYSNTWKVLR